MSQLDNIMGNIILNSSVKLEPYTLCINGENLPYNSYTSTCELNTDGDLILDFEVGSDDLLGLVDDETIVRYLSENGYIVVEG